MTKFLLLIAMIGFTTIVKAQSYPLSCHPCSFNRALDKYSKISHIPVICDLDVMDVIGDPIYCDSIPVDTAAARRFLLKNQHRVTGYYSEYGELVVYDKLNENITTHEPIFYLLHGRVINAKGAPLPGASVVVRAKLTGTEANNDGVFRVLCNPGDKVIVSYIGYKDKEITATGNDFIIVTLDQDADNCDAAVVNGYRPVNALLSTASVSNVKFEQYVVNTSILTLAQSQVPGMNVSGSPGVPGAFENVNIRGLTTPGLTPGWSNTPGSPPLIVIDGVPMPELAPINQVPSMLGDPGDLGISKNGLGYMYTLNPADVESIEILKDAAATAIYGSRGANGVILLRTRKARQGKSTLQFSATTGLGHITTAINLMHTRQYLDMRYEAFDNDKINWRQLSGPQVYDLKNMDTTRDTDFKRMMLGGTAKITNYNMSWTKGNNLFSILLSGSWHTETSVLPGDISATRGSLTGDFSYHPNNNLIVGLTGFTSCTQNNWTPFNPMYGMLLVPMAPPLQRSDGSLNWGDSVGSFLNPLSIFRNKLILNTSNTLLHTHGIYTLGKGLKAELSIGYNNLQTDEEAIYPISAKNPSMPNVTGTFATASNRYVTWNIEPQLQHTFSAARGRLSVQSIAGASFLSTNNKRYMEELSGYSRDDQLGRPGAPDSSMVNGLSQYRYLSGYSRVNLAWKQKYLLSFTFRGDASSRFGENNRLAKLGSLGAGYIVRNIDTSKIHNSILSYLKIRGSIGVTGNDMNIGNYGYMNGYTYSNNSQLYQGFGALTPTNLSNPNYQWERTWKNEIALEMSWLNKSVDLTLSYYLNKSGNLLVNNLLPSQTGFNAIATNFDAVVQNSGIELEAGYHKTWGPVTYEGKLAMAWPRNKLLRFPGLDQSAYAGSLMVGQSLTVERTKTFMGVDPATGVYLAGDSTIAGNHDPKMLAGFNQSIRVNNHWLLQTTMEWRMQNARHPMQYMYNNLAPGKRTETLLMNQPADLTADHWQKPGDVATWQKFSTRSASLANSSIPNYTNSNAQLVNGSYALLRNIRLGYEQDKGIIKNWGIRKALFFLNGENLFMITPYKGTDPQVANPLVIPPLRVISAGITLTF